MTRPWPPAGSGGEARRGEGRGAAAPPAAAPRSEVKLWRPHLGRSRRAGGRNNARHPGPSGGPAPRAAAPVSSANPGRRPPASRRRADKGRRGRRGAHRQRQRQRPRPPRRARPRAAGPSGGRGAGRPAAGRTYLFVLFLAAVPPLRVAAVGGGGRLRGLPIAVVRALVRAAARPRRRGDGLRARRNSLNIHLHLLVHCIARQKQANTFHHPASFFCFPFSLFSFLLLSFSLFFPSFLPSFLFPPQEAVTRMALAAAAAPIRRLQFSPRSSRLLYPACVCKSDSVCVCVCVSLARRPSIAPKQQTLTKQISRHEDQLPAPA